MRQRSRTIMADNMEDYFSQMLSNCETRNEEPSVYCQLFGMGNLKITEEHDTDTEDLLAYNLGYKLKHFKRRRSTGEANKDKIKKHIIRCLKLKKIKKKRGILTKM